MLASSILFLLPGCGQKTEAPGPATGAAATPGATTDVASSEADTEAVLRELTQAVRKYSIENKRLPNTFDEIVAAGYVKPVPQPPPGRKFEIDPKTSRVVLVKK